ncbi:MAG: hypothetical protein JNK47_14150 [Mesorhizobium sp.]|nr:hypothetical protein [Mesorhizobium sp.]MBL8578362.1 hypothetical protein [Mesorhizobium sp.]
MLQRIITILLTPVDPRSLREYLRPPRPRRRRTDCNDHLSEEFWDWLLRHRRCEVQRYSDWLHDRAMLPGLDSLTQWEREQAFERLEARRLMAAKPLATVIDSRGVHRRRHTD